MAILTNYVAPKAVNPFAKTIDELVDAGDGAAFELIAQTEKTEGVTGTITSQKARFQDAAREAGYSARAVENEARLDGTTRVVFILAGKRTRTAKTTEAEPTEKAVKGK